MSVDVFIERSRLGKTFYELRGVQLSISGRRGFEVFRTELELHALSHRVEHLSKRFFQPILVCFGIGAALLSVTVALVRQKALPFGAVLYFAEIAAIFAAVFLIAGVRWLPRLEVVRFKDVVGRTAFDVIRERVAVTDTDAFVALLQRRILESKQPNQTVESAAAASRAHLAH